MLTRLSWDQLLWADVQSSDFCPLLPLSLGDTTLRWGSWDAHVSSELGIAFDFLTDQGEGIHDDMSFFKNQTKIEDEEELKEHILAVQREAWDVSLT